MNIQKLTLSVIILLSITSAIVFADDAPLALLPGGNVKPIKNGNIQLKSETIDIYLHESNYTVEVNYEFLNLGDSQIALMGFPSNQNTKVEQFKASSKTQIFKTRTIPGTWDFGIKSKYIGAQFYENPINAFECFEVAFKENEALSICNTYQQSYTSNYGGGRANFYYILQTGRLWKGEIEDVVVRVHTEKAPGIFNLNSAYYNDKNVTIKDFEIRYKFIEPDFDLFFSIDYFMDFEVVKATSELSADKGITYGAKNIKDNDLSTAWIEGVQGYGINEKIIFYTNLAHNIGVPLKLDSIEFINGYAKNQTTFLENSRVKKIKIIVSSDNEDIIKPLAYSFILLDTLLPQRIRFRKPIIATDITLVIEDVYKGSRFDDTAISEIAFYVDQ